MITTLIVLGVVVYAFMNRCSLLGICGGGTNENTGTNTITSGSSDTPIVNNKAVTPTAAVPKTTTTTKTPAAAVTGDKYAIANPNAKAANCASSDHEADKGFGFSKDGGPVEADGFTADEGEPRVGDNRNRNSLTIASLPGPCETKPYKGKVQYRYRNLSASCETCQLAKQYYLYKYGTGGVNPIPGTNGGEGIREGGAKGPGVKTIVPERGARKATAAKKPAARFSRIAYI